MNIADIEKVADRKQINAEVEKLREKLNDETVNIMKLKVAQDTAYWDLREKLHQLENNYERLQQNMVEVQRQHKAISGQYEDELRLRSETLNKLKECTASNEVLNTALQSQKQFTQSICEQNNKLQEKISGLEEEHILNSEKVKGLASRLEDSNSQCRKQEKNNEELSQKAEELKNEIDEKKMIIEQSLVEQKNLKDQLFALEQQKTETVSELNKATQELELRSVKMEEMSLLIQEPQRKIAELEIILENNKVENANKINEINSVLEMKTKIIEEKDIELDCKASTISQLMLHLNIGNIARTKLENIIEKMKKEKESELSQQMSITLETLRKEKDRLQECLKNPQNTIHNIEKEVAGRSAPAAGSPRDVPKQDHNAVMRKPTPINKTDGAPPPRKIQKLSGCVVPKEPSQRLAKELDNLLYDLLSDSDTEMELMADPVKVNRHCKAISRGENMSFKHRIPDPRSLHVPLTIGTVKRIKDQAYF